MEWAEPEFVPGFSGADTVFMAGNWLLAKWNHSKCRGWQLYRRIQPHRTRWITGAGLASLDWTDDQAIRWADQQIASAGARPGDVD